MAARLLGTPVSLISLVTDDRQFFKSAIGLPEPWASRRVSPDLLLLLPARWWLPASRWWWRTPAVTPCFGTIRPSGSSAGWRMPACPSSPGRVTPSAALSVVDKTPRLWSERDIALLKDLAASVVTEIELRSEIAQRRQAEQGRRDSEEQFHSTFEDSGIGMALISPDGRWLRVNQALCEMLGVAPRRPDRLSCRGPDPPG